MKKIFPALFLFLFTASIAAQVDRVSVVQNDDGMKLVVNGKDFMINGMNWDYFPAGHELQRTACGTSPTSSSRRLLWTTKWG